jgi:hypothetical protein
MGTVVVVVVVTVPWSLATLLSGSSNVNGGALASPVK